MTDKPNQDREARTGFTFYALSGLLEILNDDRAEKIFFDFLRPGAAGSICPYCKEPLSDRMEATFRRFKWAHCIQCKNRFKATSDTPFHGAWLSPGEIILAAALVELGLDHHSIARALGRGADTVRAWMKKFEGMQ